jgi:hypothetical protein
MTNEYGSVQVPPPRPVDEDFARRLKALPDVPSRGIMIMLTYGEVEQVLCEGIKREGQRVIQDGF